MPNPATDKRVARQVLGLLDEPEWKATILDPGLAAEVCQGCLDNKAPRTPIITVSTYHVGSCIDNLSCLSPFACQEHHGPGDASQMHRS